jgi:hypothetical protein
METETKETKADRKSPQMSIILASSTWSKQTIGQQGVMRLTNEPFTTRSNGAKRGKKTCLEAIISEQILTLSDRCIILAGFILCTLLSSRICVVKS